MDCACQKPPQFDTPPRRTVTLVHGTYARHARWMQDGDGKHAALAHGIAAIPGTLVYRFCWRGRNRHGDRARAAAELRHHLTRVAGEFRDAEHHVVAHSHGGNVALYALRDATDGLDRVRLVTLGTPFLAMRRRELPKAVLMLSLLSVAVSVGVAISDITGWDEILGTDADDGILWLVGFWIGFAAFAAVTIAAVLLLLLLARSLLVYRRGGTTSGLLRLLSGRAVDTESHAVTSPRIPSERLLVVRANGDEAAAVLAMAQLSSWVLERVLSFYRRHWGKTIIIGVILGFFVGEEPISNLIFSIGLAIVIAGAFSAIFLLGVSYLPFGSDMLFWAFHAELTASPSPMGYSRAFQDEVASETHLAHSVYNDPEVIGAVTRWIENGSAA